MLIVSTSKYLAIYFLSPFVSSAEPKEENATYNGERNTDEGRVVVAQTILHGKTAAEGADGIADVERHLNAGATEHLAAGRKFQDEKLLRTAHGEETGGADHDQQGAQPATMGYEEDGEKRQGRAALGDASDHTRTVVVAEFATRDVAHHHAKTGAHHDER